MHDVHAPLGGGGVARHNTGSDSRGKGGGHNTGSESAGEVIGKGITGNRKFSLICLPQSRNT